MKGIQRQLRQAWKNVTEDISSTHSHGGIFGRGFAAEGYAGGYRDALSDVQLALLGILPSNSRYWPAERAGSGVADGGSAAPEAERRDG